MPALLPNDRDELMTALGELRKLDDAASPGVCDCDGPALCKWCLAKDEARAKRNALSHLLRPAFEALEKLDACAKWDGGDTPEEVELNYTQFSEALGNSRAVLARLAEALK